MLAMEEKRSVWMCLTCRWSAPPDNGSCSWYEDCMRLPTLPEEEEEKEEEEDEEEEKKEDEEEEKKEDEEGSIPHWEPLS